MKIIISFYYYYFRGRGLSTTSSSNLVEIEEFIKWSKSLIPVGTIQQIQLTPKKIVMVMGLGLGLGGRRKRKSQRFITIL